MKREIAGQLDLFSPVFAQMLSESQRKPVIPEKTVEKTVVEKVLSSAEDYLQRGERITNIAREHLKRCIEKRNVTWSDELLYGLNLNAERESCEECLSKVRLLAGKYLRSIKEEGDEACKAIYELTGKRVRITLHPDRMDVARCVSRKKCMEDTPICLHIYDGDEEIFSTYSMKDYAFPTKYRMFLFHGGYLVSDGRTIIAYCILYHAVEKVFYGENTELKGLLLKEAAMRAENAERMMAGIIPSLEDAVAVPGMNGRNKRIVCSGFYSMKDRGCFEGVKIHVPYDDGIGEFAWSVLEKYGVELIDENRTKAQLADARRQLALEPVCDEEGNYLPEQVCRVLTGLYLSGSILEENYLKQRLWPLALTNGEFPSFKSSLIKSATFGKSHFEHTVFQETYCCGWGYNDRWIFDCFYILYKMQHSIAEQWSDYEKSEGDYAKSYMIKANIPAKTLSAMESSELNQYFGFVEYDEDVDLAKVVEVEKQFIAVKETYFKDIDSGKNAIRFRKLGNHKAIGLYYPGVKCLCVDYRHTDSFIHEYGHLIDYELGSLSLKGGFYPIRVKYEECLKKRMQGDSVVNAQMNGKSKYNLSYYLKPTEIFARSFEIYCSIVLGICNDLLPVNFNANVYPYEDESFVEELTVYFNALFNISKDVGESDGEEVLHEVA